MAICFDSTESSSGFPKNRYNVSKFIVHSGIPRPDDDSRVEICCHKNILCNKLLCLTEIYILYELDKPVPVAQWPRCLSRRSAAARLLRSWVRIPPGAWIFVCCECRVLSDRGLCDELITRPEESYRLWCVVVCDLETSRMRRSWPALGRSAVEEK
jgi:hypothetical protein